MQHDPITTSNLPLVWVRLGPVPAVTYIRCGPGSRPRPVLNLLYGTIPSHLHHTYLEHSWHYLFKVVTGPAHLSDASSPTWTQQNQLHYRGWNMSVHKFGVLAKLQWQPQHIWSPGVGVLNTIWLMYDGNLNLKRSIYNNIILLSLKFSEYIL